ncbi:MAG: hypothetical protein WKG00_39770 [Polyangiaceae bacterium]
MSGRSATKLCLSLFLGACAATLSFAGCSSVDAEGTATPRAVDPCAPGGKLRPPPGEIVATTTTPGGDLIDWIRPTPEMFEPPPPSPAMQPGAAMPPGPISPPPSAPPGTPGPIPGPVDIGPKGPPGTVPFVRLKAPQCDCFDGYLLMKGLCKPAATVCGKPGEGGSARYFPGCCSGLAPVAASEKQDGQCTDLASDDVVCVRCGDGVCGTGENECRCPGDCPP